MASAPINHQSPIITLPHHRKPSKTTNCLQTTIISSQLASTNLFQ
jgi:hypothetical protein